MKGISIWGVAAGTAVTIVLDVVVSIALVTLLAPSGASTETVAAFTHTAVYAVWSLILGTVTTVVGGYVAARIGNMSPYINAALVGVLGVVIAFLLGSPGPLWFNIIGYGVVIPAALLGGYVAAARTTAV